MTYGFGVRQVERIVSAFNNVLLVADESHSILNKSAFQRVVALDKDLPYFSFRATKNHAKIAIVDEETVILTSANLSANRRIEVYSVFSADEIGSGMDDIRKIMGNPCQVFKGDGLDFEFNLDFNASDQDMEW